MKLRRLFPLLPLVAALAGCSMMDAINPFSSSAKVKMADLPTFKATAEIRPLWQMKAGKADGHVFTPAVVDGTVYTASGDGTLTRFEDGKQVWRIAVGKPLSAGVGANNRLVVVGTAKGDVLAFSAADGKPLWSAQVNSEILAAPAVGDGIVVVRSGDNRLFGFDSSDGTRKWIYTRNNPPLSLRNAAPPVISDRYVFAGFPGGKLVAVALQNGALAWEGTVALPKGTTELDRVADITSTPVFDGPLVCAVAYQGRVACFDLSNGSLAWAREISSAAGLAMDSRNVYVTDDKGAVHAYERTRGTSVWKQDKLFLRQLTAPAVQRGLVAVGDVQGQVHFLNREDGSFAARYSTDGSPILAAPQVYANGWLVQTSGGSVQALEPR